MIYVIGDVMLDKYVNGTTSRMSPEAPVPILLKNNQKNILGGAANVSLNIGHLSNKVKLFGIIGNDNNGNILKDILNDKEIDFEFIVSKNKPTITKTRFLSSSRQILRVDKEINFDFSESKELFELVLQHSKNDNPNIFLISDYDKNSIHKDLPLKEYIDLKKLIIDSKKTDLSIFEGSLLYKSNFSELCNIANAELDISKIDLTAYKVLEKNNFKYLITTLASEGCFFAEKDGGKQLIPTEKVEVADVTGAGDNFIATLAYLLEQNYKIREAITIALKYATESVKHTGNYFEDIMEIKE